MMPDVTNQADKEQGLSWTDAQLWVQLCMVVRPAHSLKERERERKRGGGTEKRDREAVATSALFWNNRLRSRHQNVRQIHLLHSCHFKPKKEFVTVFPNSHFLFCSPLPLSPPLFSLSPTLSLSLSIARTGPAQHISKISCSDSSFSPNPAIMKSYAIIASCGFGRYNTNQTLRDLGVEEWEKLPL